MLNDIRLSEGQLAALDRAAVKAGARLDPDYLGEFRPGGSLRCVALQCTSPGQLMRFSGEVLDLQLLGQLAARVQEDGPYRPGGQRSYYWPGVLAA